MYSAVCTKKTINWISCKVNNCLSTRPTKQLFLNALIIDHEKKQMYYETNKYTLLCVLRRLKTEMNYDTNESLLTRTTTCGFSFQYVLFCQSVKNIVFWSIEYVEIRTKKTPFVGSFITFLQFKEKCCWKSSIAFENLQWLYHIE